MTVLEIVKAYLRANGYDGLWNPDGACGCPASEPCPLDGPLPSCEPAYRLIATQKDIETGVEAEVGDEIFGPKKAGQ